MNELDLWWAIIVGTAILLVLALGFVIIILYNERTTRKLEGEKMLETQIRFEESEAMRHELESLSKKMMQMQEEDRLRISRELHDEVGQTITAIDTNLKIALQDLPASEKAIHSRLSESQSLAREVKQRIGLVIRELRPIDFSILGLIPTLAKYISEFESRTGINTAFHYDPMEDELSLSHKDAIYRIVQESLTNIVRHSSASEARISLLERVTTGENGSAGSSTTVTFLEITDNGQGFDRLSPTDRVNAEVQNPDASKPDPGERSGGVGLIGIQERVKLLAGTFNIISTPGSGTKISVTIPWS